jgi:hypothetical protein
MVFYSTHDWKVLKEAIAPGTAHCPKGLITVRCMIKFVRVNRKKYENKRSVSRNNWLQNNRGNHLKI